MTIHPITAFLSRITGRCLLLLPVAVHASPARAEIGYAITDVGQLGSWGSTGRAINNAGQVVGGSSIQGEQSDHAYRWTPGEGIMGLGTLGGTESRSLGVNHLGDVVGWAAPSGGGFPERHAFLWTQASGIIDLGTLGPTSEAFHVNASQQVIGDSYGQPFFWESGGGMVLADTLLPDGSGWSAIVLNDISDAGLLVGTGTNPSGEARGFVLNAHVDIIEIGTLGGSWSTANGINADGWVVGNSALPDETQRAFVWKGADPLINLGTLGGASSSADAISDGGYVLGQSAIEDGSNHYFLWTGSQMIDLTVLTQDSDWSLESFSGLGDYGISGTGTPPGAVYKHGFVMTISGLVDPFFVTSLADPGDPGDDLVTLREAIDAANAAGDPVTITFDPSLAGGTIQPLSQLPTITGGNITIDGDIDGDGTPDIEIDGSLAGDAHGLLIISSGNSVRGLAVNRNGYDAIVIFGSNATENVVSVCFVGTGLDGVTPRGGGHGIVLTDGASGNIIGPANVISGNGSPERFANGILIMTNAVGNIVFGNRIGLAVTGDKAVPNSGQGIRIADGASSNCVGGPMSSDRNTIAGNTGHGVEVGAWGEPCVSNTIRNNYIGTTVDGLSSLGNGAHGVLVNNAATDTTIGPDNVISGNDEAGVWVSGLGTNNNRVVGNIIGLNATGDSSLGNRGHGVAIWDAATGNTVGGLTKAERNVISDNGTQDIWGTGITINGSANNVILGNYIGTDVTGMASFGNGGNGINIENGSTLTTIGPGNVISGNWQNGLAVGWYGAPSNDNQILGNLIGISADRTESLGNGVDGLLVNLASSNNLIGPDNDISGSWFNNIVLADAGTSMNSVFDNTIGTQLPGAFDGDDGVDIRGGASGNVIGPGNVIAYHAVHGVNVRDAASTDNKITENSITANDGLGIHLDGGNNGLLAPAILIVTPTEVSGTSSALDDSVIEVFLDSDDEGETFVGSTIVEGGEFVLAVEVPSEGVNVTATVTDADGNTSAFSAVIDCNGNGIQDALEMGTGDAPDCNGNGIPDDCDFDEDDQAPGGEAIIGDLLVASREFGTIYAMNPGDGLIHSLVSGLELRDQCGLERGAGDSLADSYRNSLLALADGRLLVRVSEPLGGLFDVDLATGDRTRLDGTDAPEWNGAGGITARDAETVLSTVDHFGQPGEGTVLSYDLVTNATTMVSGPTVGDGPTLNEPRGVAMLDGDTALVLESGFVTNPAEVGLFLIDIPSGDRTFLSRLTPFAFERTLIVDGEPAGTVTLGDDEGGDGPVSNSIARSVAVVDGRIIVGHTVLLPDDETFSGGLMEIDPATGDRTLLVGQAYEDDGDVANVIVVLPSNPQGIDYSAPIGIQGYGGANIIFTSVFVHQIFQFNLDTAALDEISDVEAQVDPTFGPTLRLSGLAVLAGEDCNFNGVPDAQDIAQGDSLDCNDNGIPDECDITSGTSDDCQLNGIPDECDVADGTSDDDNDNGIPDECDVTLAVALSCVTHGDAGELCLNLSLDGATATDPRIDGGTKLLLFFDGYPVPAFAEDCSNIVIQRCSGGVIESSNLQCSLDSDESGRMLTITFPGLPDQKLPGEDCHTVDVAAVGVTGDSDFVIRLLAGDANTDTLVDPLDNGAVLARFGCDVDPVDPGCVRADINNDGTVDPLDTGAVLARFGDEACPCD